MKFPTWTKQGVWCAIGGAVLMTIGGFWGLGWTTKSSAERMASTRAESAVISALVPLCIAAAKLDADPAKLVKFRAETSSYSRSEMVQKNGWATVAGMTSPDYALTQACSERLQVNASL